MSSAAMRAASAYASHTQAPHMHRTRRLPDTSRLAVESTSALVVELAQLRYTLRDRTAQDSWGSPASVDREVRSLLQQCDAVLAELRGRGLDFGDPHLEPWRTAQQEPSTSVGPCPGPDQSTSVDLTAKIEQLERGLSSRTVIGQAQGILIERHQVTADQAFRILVQASQTTNRKLRAVASHLVLTGQLAARSRAGPTRVPGES